MRMIGFKGEYIDPILTGAKTTTIRAAALPGPALGEIVKFRCRYDRPPFAHARVTGITVPLQIDDLTEAHAEADGFGSLDALKHAVLETYGHKPLAVYEFVLVDAPPPPEPPNTLL